MVPVLLVVLDDHSLLEDQILPMKSTVSNNVTLIKSTLLPFGPGGPCKPTDPLTPWGPESPRSP